MNTNTLKAAAIFCGSNRTFMEYVHLKVFEGMTVLEATNGVVMVRIKEGPIPLPTGAYRIHKNTIKILRDKLLSFDLVGSSLQINQIMETQLPEIRVPDTNQVVPETLDYERAIISLENLALIAKAGKLLKDDIYQLHTSGKRAAIMTFNSWYAVVMPTREDVKDYVKPGY